MRQHPSRGVDGDVGHRHDRHVREWDIRDGFQDVDRVGGARPFVDYLDSAGRQLAPLKGHVMEALSLGAGDHVLEVGSGTGDDLRDLAQTVGVAGRVVGIDSSQELVDEARHRTRDYATVEVHQGDAHRLGFPDGTFDRVRVERVLMHVTEPAVVVGELTRVLRAGGRLVLAEPDWDTLVLDSDDLATARRAARLVANGARHPDIGRRLARLATAHGLQVHSIDCVSSVMRNCEMANGVLRIEDAIERENDDVVRAWWHELRQRSPREDFLAVLTFVVVTARKERMGSTVAS